MARKTSVDKAIDEQVETAFQKHGSCVEFNVMDLGKIMNAGRDAARAGTSVDDAVIRAVEQYRKN